MRILLAEDDPVIASHVIEALGREGYVVERTSSGPETWEKGDLGTYDAVILDLGLPELDGLTLLHRWRRGGTA